MKKVVILIFWLLNISYAYSDNRGIVSTTLLNIVDAPSVNSNTISSKNVGSIIEIYDEKGTGEFKNGQWDKWYKINKTKDQWVNAYYIMRLPIMLSYSFTSEMGELFKEYYDISDFKYEDSQTFFFVQLRDSNYLTVKQNYWIKSDEINWIDNKSPKLGYMGKVLLAEDNTEIKSIMSKDNITSNDNLSVIYRKNGVMIDFFDAMGGHITKIEIDDDNFTFPFGIKVGDKIEKVENILGEEYQVHDNNYIYEIGYGSIYTFTFYVENKNIKSIIFTNEF